MFRESLTTLLSTVEAYPLPTPVNVKHATNRLFQYSQHVCFMFCVQKLVPLLRQDALHLVANRTQHGNQVRRHPAL